VKVSAGHLHALSGANGSAEDLGLGAESLNGSRAERSGRAHGSVSTTGLGEVQRGVGGSNERCGIGAVLGIGSDAEAQDRAADVVFGATVPEPGRWVPHALVEQDEGGPGKLLIGPRGPIFVTNRGITHDYGWAWFKRFTVDEASGEISLQTDPGQLAVIRFVPQDEILPWPELLEAHGLERVVRL